MSSEHDRVAVQPEQPAFAEAMVGKATIPPGHPWNRLPMIGAVCAVLGTLVCAILGTGNPKQFFFSWLVSFLFFLSLALGALFFVLIQYAAQGGWGIVLRRIGETIFATLPVMAALFLPLLLGLRDLYSWTVPGAAEHDALLRWKAPYLNVPFFLIRAALYFGIWSFIALLSVVAAALRRPGLLDTVISTEHLHDIGKFLFAFTAFWAYIGFSQFFLMWSENLPAETIWYKVRIEGPWLP